VGLIVAEWALAEAFVDDDSRCIFHNALEFHVLYPYATVQHPVRYCSPRLGEGSAVETFHRKLIWRAPGNCAQVAQ
jgi:hypothetical protein